MLDAFDVACSAYANAICLPVFHPRTHPSIHPPSKRIANEDQQDRALLSLSLLFRGELSLGSLHTYDISKISAHVHLLAKVRTPGPGR